MPGEIKYYRGVSKPTEAPLVNPLQLRNPYSKGVIPTSGVFFGRDRTDEDAKLGAEHYAKTRALSGHEGIVIGLTVTPESFPLLRINTLVKSPFEFDSRMIEEPVLTFEDLEQTKPETITVNAEGITQEQLLQLRIELGKLGAEGRFTYEEWRPPATDKEGSKGFGENKDLLK